jgi:phosphate-selective porin OprO/OprP
MKTRSLLLASAALFFAAPAFADDAAIEKRLDAMQKMIDAQQQQIAVQKSEIGTLRKALVHKGVKIETAAAPTPAATPAPTPLEAKVADQQVQIDDMVAKFSTAQNDAKIAKADSARLGMAGARPSFSSADGRFTMAIRAIGQLDTGYYMQGAKANSLAAANGPDLSSGTNFRRVQLGLQGKVFGDWSYFFNYDFAGSGGTETPGHIQSAYIEYDGISNLAVRIGAFAPSAGLEDNTGAADTMFLERNSPSDLARNIAGGDGRTGIGVIYTGERLYGALTLTGDKIQDSGVFDEQQALLGRLSGLVYSDDDTKLVLSGNGTYVFKVADTAAGPGAVRSITLSDPPELTVDNTGTKLVSSGALNAENVWEWGLESAAQWRNLYGQAGYFAYGVDQRAASAADNFDGWYAQASWVLTGESRDYSSVSGAFANPKPHENFSLDGGGWGAWEIAARYSDLDLNDNAGVAGTGVPAGGIRGGDQGITTIGLNWYPNSVLKFELQYQNIVVSRLGTIPAAAGHAAVANTGVGQNLNTIALRSQIAF